MSLPSLNATQEAQALTALFKSTASFVAPLLLLESFMMGALCAWIPAASYILWIKSTFIARAPSITMLWIGLTAMMIHWALSLRQLESTLSGRSLGISLTIDELFDVIYAATTDNITSSKNELIGDSYFDYSAVWMYFLALVTETVFFGFASSLFAFVAYISLRQSRAQWKSWPSSIILSMASLMYTLSLIHWALSLRCFTLEAHAAATDTFSAEVGILDVVLLAVLSFNTTMSDSIVLWRMCVVWDRKRPALVLAMALVLATLCLNIANIAMQARHPGVDTRVTDPELYSTYGETSVGLAAAFISLASNLVATTLVGIKVWSHRRQISNHLATGNRRTLAVRFMEILVDSGLVYTAIWLLYCVSFFREITTQPVIGPATQDTWPVISAVTHIDSAMAQITCIYPLIIFILVAMDQIHHSRGPRTLRNNDWLKDRVTPVAVSLNIDVERSTTQNMTAAHPTIELRDTNPLTVNDTKIFDSE